MKASFSDGFNAVTRQRNLWNNRSLNHAIPRWMEKIQSFGWLICESIQALYHWNQLFRIRPPPPNPEPCSLAWNDENL